LGPVAVTVGAAQCDNRYPRVARNTQRTGAETPERAFDLGTNRGIVSANRWCMSEPHRSIMRAACERRFAATLD
jgi:hypothetical protein